jgi:hypothetical protein
VDDHSAWEKRIQQRFPAYSEAGSEAGFFDQWVFTGKFIDHGTTSAVCGLCGNQNLRYHFLVAHRETGEAIWVGSQCVLNFGASEKKVAKKRRLARKKNRKAQEPAIEEERILAIFDQLQTIYPKVTQNDQRKIRWLVGKFQQCGAFSPEDAAWIFQVMLVCGLQPKFQLFPISLRTKKEKAELAALPLTTRRLVAASLTEEQKATCEEMDIHLGD